jgi:hypothetical protein
MFPDPKAQIERLKASGKLLPLFHCTN